MSHLFDILTQEVDVDKMSAVVEYQKTSCEFCVLE